MIEIAEFSVYETHAAMYLDGDVGEPVGTMMRKIRVRTDDPLYARIGELSRLVEPDTFFESWSITRVFAKHELTEAPLILPLLPPRSRFTARTRANKYDDKHLCTLCKAGGAARAPLRMNLARAPRRRDFVCTASGEYLVSEPAAAVIKDVGLRGVRLHKVEDPGASAGHRQPWYMIECAGAKLQVSTSTRAGVHPFLDDTKGHHRCPFSPEANHVLGRHRLSALHVAAESWDGSDMALTAQWFGDWRETARPVPLLVLSQRCYQAFAAAKLRGLKVEAVNFQ